MSPRNKYERKEDSFVSGLTIILVAISAFILGFALSRTGLIQLGNGSGSETETQFLVTNRSSKDVEDIDFGMFWEVWGHVEADYVDENADQQAMFHGAMKGMVNSLDDAGTVYFTAEEYQQYQEQSSGSYEGVGMYLGYENGFVIIEQPIKGSPAEASGAKAGDIILKVDGEALDGKSVEEVVMQIRGEAGTQVTITVISKENSAGEHDLLMTREEISVPAITWEQKEDGIAVIEISRFTESTLPVWKSEWNEVVDEVVASGSDVVIVDLRSNGGGFLEAGVYAAEEFLSPGSLVTSQVLPRQNTDYKYTVMRESNLRGVEVIVLVNEYTASASEIFAGALQKNNRAIVIGERTTGKGTAQQIFELDDGSALKLTIANGVMPDGVVLSHENPIVPDEEVVFDKEAWEQGSDNVMDYALEKARGL